MIIMKIEPRLQREAQNGRPKWRGAAARTPTAQFGELGQAKPQTCVRATESEFSAVGMTVGRLLDASPQTAGGSHGSGAILRLLGP